MSEIDYEELIRSPLDDVEERSEGGWSLAVVGMGLGLVLGSLLAAVLGGGQDESEVVAAITTTSTSVVPFVVASDYPTGYTEIAPGLAAHANEVILGEEFVTVGFTTAVRRGDNPAVADWPVGGVWVLESGSGATAESVRVVIGRVFPGVFSVQFPAAPFSGEAEFVTARVVERWDRETFVVSEQMPFAGEPFTAPEPLVVPVNQDVTLINSELRLGRFFGWTEWRTTGAELGTTVNLIATLTDGDGAVVGTYAGSPVILEPAHDGVIELRWGEPFPTDQEGAVTASLGFTVGVVQSVPVSIGFDLNDVPVGR